MELSVNQNKSTNQVRAVEHVLIHFHWNLKSGSNGGFIDGTFVMFIQSQYISET